MVLIFNKEGNEILSVLETNSDIYLYLGNERVEQGMHIYEWTMPINNLEKTGITSQHMHTYFQMQAFSHEPSFFRED